MAKRTPVVTFELLEDNDGVKRWLIEAIHVTITGNKRKYTEDELKLGARSLSYRPININHEDELWLPHNPFNPDDSSDNRTLALTFVPKERGVTGKIQIADPEVNEMIQNGDINRLSIEQKPIEGEECGCNMLEGCFCEQHGITFTGIALLTADTRPGDPATRIRPESMATIKDILEKLKAKFKEQRPKKIEALKKEASIQVNEIMKKYAQPFTTATNTFNILTAGTTGTEHVTITTNPSAKKEGIDDDMADCMAEMKGAHPDMDHDQMVAVCLKKTGQSSQEADHDDDAGDDNKNKDGFKCEECGKMFGSKDDLEKHYAAEHGKGTEKEQLREILITAVARESEKLLTSE